MTPSEEQLSTTQVLDVISAGVDDIQRCYEEGFPGTALPVADFRFRWSVAPDGSVRNVTLIQSVEDGDVAVNCMRAVIASWKFPRRKGDKDLLVTFPWHCEPTSDE